MLPKCVNACDMRTKVLAFVAFLVQCGVCFKLEDVLPIKYDVVHVRSERQMRSAGERFAVLDFIGLVERHARGYTAEEYKLTTQDGYILLLHRITGAPASPRATGKPIVFLQHGLLLSSDGFVVNGPGRDLAFLLADAGYDVWLGNARGNTYGRRHVYLKPDDKKFWDFSFHEIAMYDLSAEIDYALETTGQPRLILVGYSMGTTEAFALLAARPEYNDKVSLLINFTPIVFWKHKLPPFMKYVVNNFEAIKEFLDKYRYYEVLPQSSFVGNWAKTFCSDKTKRMQMITCTLFFSTVAPIVDIPRLNTTAYPTFLSHFPAGVSTKCFEHYVQNIISQKFQAFDYGPQRNYMKYKRKTPPVYDLGRITTPVALYYGKKDYFASLEDNFYLAEMLPNLVLLKKIPNDNFNHLDVILAKDVRSLLYDNVMSLINKFTRSLV